LLKPFFFIPVFKVQEMGKGMAELGKIDVSAVGGFTVEIDHAQHVGK
jgi:hypothetical protein